MQNRPGQQHKSRTIIIVNLAEDRAADEHEEELCRGDPGDGAGALGTQ